MTYNRMKNLYDTLNGNGSLTTLADINVGWNLEDISYPCVNIVQAGGSQTGLTGYGSGGLIDEIFTVQIDIYSRESMMETYQILEVLYGLMISECYYKSSDNDMYDDDLHAHRKVTRWTFQTID